MKSVKIVLIVILCGLIAFLCAVLGLFLVRKGSNNGNFSLIGNKGILSTYELLLEEEIDSVGIENIVIDYGMNSNDVIIYQASGDKIIVKEYVNFEADDSLKSTVEQSGDTLTVRGKKRNDSIITVFNMNSNGYTEIYLPQIVLENLTVTTISGDAKSDLSFQIQNTFRVSTTSGDIRFNNVKANSLQISAVSGDINIEETIGDLMASSISGCISINSAEGNILLNAVSGDIELDSLQGYFELGATSGDIYVRNGKGYGRVNTVSGDVSISLNELAQNLSAETTSGEVYLRIPENASFDFEYSTTSGDCRTFFDDILSYTDKRDHAKGTYGESTGKQIRVSTGSGDLTILQY